MVVVFFYQVWLLNFISETEPIVLIEHDYSLHSLIHFICESVDVGWTENMQLLTIC